VKRRTWIAAAGSALLLAGCGKEQAGDAPAAAAAGSAPVSIDKIAAEAKGFNVGSTMSARVVYVFFDPQCPHCAALWEAAKPLKPQARFVWIPVALLGDKSIAQGAAILSAADPVAAMDQNEASLRQQQGGISAMGVADAQKDAVKRNTALMTSFGFNGVPAVVGKHAQSGEVVTIDGALPTQALAQRLGLNPPGAS
jgi:thiol:disulfide interchange protein DsbG